MKNNQKFYSMEKTTDTGADIFIYGDITSYKWDENDTTAFGFKEDLESLGEISELNVHINSYGGETFQALAIYNLLKQYKATINVYIDGIAASSASIIAMAGDKIYMPKTALMMIHNCWTIALGNAKELRKTAEDMDKIAVAYKSAYLSKINITEEKLNELLDEETFLTANECADMGFVDEIIDLKEDNAVNQHANLCMLKLVNKLKQQTKQKNIGLDEETTEKIVEQISNNLIKQREPKQKSEPKPIKEDAWASFFNTKK